MRVIDKFYGKFIWILTGILFALAGSMMLISGTFNTERFYDVGMIHDISQNDLKTNMNDTMYYDVDKQAWIVTSETAIKNILVSNSKWKYLYMSMSNISSGSFAARIDCYVDFELVHQMDVKLSEGENLLSLSGIEFNEKSNPPAMLGRME